MVSIILILMDKILMIIMVTKMATIMDHQTVILMEITMVAAMVI